MSPGVNVRAIWATFRRRDTSTRMDDGRVLTEDPWAGKELDLNPLAIRGVTVGIGDVVNIEMWIEGEAPSIPVKGTLKEVREAIDNAVLARAALAVAGAR